MTMMQKNPQEVMQRYGNNPEFMQVFQEFCKIMGMHFSELTETPKTATEIENQRIQKILNEDIDVIVPQQKMIFNSIYYLRRKKQIINEKLNFK